MFRWMTLLVLPLGLIACTSPSKKECEEMNWAKIGYTEGYNGQGPQKKLKEYDKSCTREHGVLVNLGLFNSGYQKGLKMFCRKDKGFKSGAAGKDYSFPSICPGKYQRGYKKAYKRGIKVFCGSENFEARGRKGQTFQFPRVCPQSLEIQARASHQKGVKNYCTYEVGLSKGQTGQSYNNVCPKEWEGPFLKGYNLGFQKRTLHKIDMLTSQVSDLEGELNRKNRELENLNDRIDDLEDDLEDKEREIRSLKGDGL